MVRQFFIYFSAATALFAALDVMAQFPGGGMRRGNRDYKDSSNSSTRNQQLVSPATLSNQIEYRLDLLREELRLTPSQEQVWFSYASKVMAMVSDITRQNNQLREVHDLAAPRQMDRVMDIARDRLTGIEDVSMATKRFYEMLLPEQKRLMDVRLVSLMPLLSSAISGGADAAQQNLGPLGGGDRSAR